MSKLTDQLSQNLINHREYPLVKSVAANTWYTGRDLEEDVAALREQFAEQKIGAGDQVLIVLPNSPVFLPLNQALWEIGAVAHPIAAKTPVPELLDEWTTYHYQAVITLPALGEAMEAPLIPWARVRLHTMPELAILTDAGQLAYRINAPQMAPREDDLALILNTSGTTGKPKRVGLTHRMLVNAAHYDIMSHALTPDDTAMVVMPMFHINAQVISVLATRLSGGKLVIAPKFSASAFWPTIEDNHVTWVSVVPTIISILLMNQNALKAYHDNIHLRFVRSSSFALPEDKLVSFQSRFHTQVLEGYGMTETASQSTLNPIQAPKIGSAGKPVGTDLRIRLADGTLTKKPFVEGEIVLRGDHVIHDYLEPHPDSFADGWFLTGDIGYLDQDGYLFVKGRRKEMINRGGEKVAPAKVENVLNELDWIAQVAVIGLPDNLYGEAVTAVVIRQDPTADPQNAKADLLDFARHHLAAYECPTEVVFVKAFPVNTTGKVLRPKLRDQLMRGGKLYEA